MHTFIQLLNSAGTEPALLLCTTLPSGRAHMILQEIEQEIDESDIDADDVFTELVGKLEDEGIHRITVTEINSTII